MAGERPRILRRKHTTTKKRHTIKARLRGDSLHERDGFQTDRDRSKKHINFRQTLLPETSAHTMSDHSMKRTYFPGITDVVIVSDTAEIRTISKDARFDRELIGHGPFRNVQ
jgi:hypothetical protein